MGRLVDAEQFITEMEINIDGESIILKKLKDE